MPFILIVFIEKVVLSGHTEAIDLVIDRLCTNSFSSSIIKVIPLKVSAPFHCAPLMNSSANQFKEWILNWPDFKVSLSNDSQIPVLSTCTLERLHFRGTLDFVEYCERQILEPVLWKKAMDLATTHKVNVFGEIGSSTLQAISRRDFPNCQFFSIMETNF